MPSTNNETLQLLGLLLGILLPDIQVVDLTLVTVKLPIDLFKVLPHYFGP